MKPRLRFPVGLIAALALFTLGVLATGWALQFSRQSSEKAGELAFGRLVERTETALLRRLRQPLYGLGTMRGAVSVLGELPDPLQFEHLFRPRDLAVEFPGVTGFALVEQVERSRVAEYESRMAAYFDGGFRVHPKKGQAGLYVVRSIEPLSENLNALGLDIGSEPNRRGAVERALVEEIAILSEPIQLVQDPQRRWGALYVMPVFRSGLAQRGPGSDPVVAFVYAAIIYDVLLEALVPDQPAPLRLALIDLQAQPQPVQVYPSQPREIEDVAPGALYYERVPLQIGGRAFALDVASTPAFESTWLRSAPWFGAVLGLLASALAGLLVMNLLRTRASAVRLAEGMTEELNRLAMVARLTGNAVVLLDLSGRIRWLNPAYEALAAAPAETLIGRTPVWLEEPDDPKVAQQLQSCIRSGRAFDGRVRAPTAASELRWIDLELQPTRGRDGQLTGAVAILSDITASLRQSEALRASEAFLRRAGRVAGVGGWQLDLGSGTLSWSAETRRIHEVPPDFVPTVDSAIGFFVGEARSTFAGALAKATSRGDPLDLELPMCTFTGSRIWVRVVGEAEFTDGRPLRLIGALQDVTSRVEQERALSAERRRLGGIIEGTRAGTWEWNVETGELRINARWAEIIGETPQSLAPMTIQSWADRLAEEDGERLRGLLRQHFSGQLDYFESESRIRHRDGHWVWVLDSGRVLTWTPDGRPEWMFGTHLDISQRRQMELALEEHRRLLSTTLRSIGDAVLTSDAEGRVTWLNPVAESLTGWRSEDALGRLAAEVLRLHSEGSDEPATCPIALCLRERHKVGLSQNTVLVSRDGHARFAIEDSVSPLWAEDGRLLGAVMVFHDVTEQRMLAQQMTHRARHDALTDLPNRDEFEQRLDETLGRVAGGEFESAVLFIDLDHFKVVNDTCGHGAGDELLREVAQLMQRAVRNRDLVARFGGDEFVVLLESCPLDRAEAIANSLCMAVDGYRFEAANGRRFQVGASIGVVPLDGRWQSRGELLKAADAACYMAKNSGRGRVVVSLPNAEVAPAAEGLQWSQRIEQALDEDRFVLMAQRMAALANPDAPGPLSCEVLLRLRGDDGELVAPAQFMPSAERYQLATRIDRWVLQQVLETLLHEGSHGIERIAINLSAQSVVNRDFHRFMQEQIAGSGVDPRLLCIEIPEAAAVANFDAALDFVEGLHEVGARVALDDFGAGATSFGYLRSLKADQIKIEGHFVRGLRSADPTAAALDAAAIRCFIDVAEACGIRAAAKHIEDAETLDQLLAMGVRSGQGFHLHRPESLQDALATRIPQPAEPG